MNFHFQVESLADAVYAKAALDGILSVGVRSQNGTKVEATAGTILNTGALTSAGVVTGSDPDYKPGDPFPKGPVAEEPKAMYDLREEPDAHTHHQVDDSPDFTKEQIKAAAAHCPELAALVGKRGKKSEVEKAKIKELTALHLPNAPAEEERVGEALAGATAEELQEALTTGVHENTTTEPVAEAETKPTGLAALDPDLAAIASQRQPAATEAAPQQASGDLSALSDAELYQRIQDYGESDEGGFSWFRNVVAQGGGNINKLPREHMLKVLENPAAFNA